ncbi:MAG: hypothetical protein R6X23_05845 [Acidimicrobiia bacterium]
MVDDVVAVVVDSVVVAGAEVAEHLVGGEAAVGDGCRVMSVQVGAGVTPADLAVLVAFGDRDLQGCGDVAGGGHDGLDVDAVGDDELEEPVGEDLAGVGDGDGPDAGDLAGLAGCGVAA